MKKLRDKFTRIGTHLSTWMLAPVVAVMSSPALAALPTMPTPGTDMSGNAVADGDWLGSMSAWFKAGIVILGLILCGIAFIYVVAGALTKWKQYSEGRAQIADLKEYFIMGSILVVFIVMMVTYAFQTIGQT